MKLLLWFVIPAAVWAQATWERRAPYPAQVTEVSSAALNGKVYSVCGVLADGVTRGTKLYIYDPYIDDWSEGPPVPIPGGGDSCNVAAANGKLYVLGAMRVGTPFVDGNTYQYDPGTGQWSTVARMGEPRAASGVAVIGNRIYVAGGYAITQSTAAFEVFDTDTRQWSRLPDLPTARDHLTAQAVNGRIYAISGRSGITYFRANEEFDPAANTWNIRAAALTARAGMGSGALRNRIQVFGGEGNTTRPDGIFEQNEEYDPASDTWGILPPMSSPRHGLYGATLAGRIFAPGGGPAQGLSYSNTNDAFFLALPGDPTVDDNGVKNSASFRPELSPGTIVMLQGKNLSQGEQMATRLPLPVQLNGTSVRVNNALVPLLYVGPNQINFQLPYTLVPGPSDITVTHVGRTGNAVAGPSSAAVAPGVFAMSGNGVGQGAVRVAGTIYIARAADDGISRPARRGEYVSIYCTGLGRVEFPPRPGEPPPPDPPIRTVDTPEVSIGGAPAEVSFSGLAPGSVGLYQINAKIAAAAQTGNAVPLTVSIGGKTSNTVAIAVAE
ncbi:MAG: hypothetical protein LC126_28260 [Bryobacterales bacterium]|nr:hypothetical protein [Bryobacterales bacterium]